ncbi:molybdenum cofactor guanylyltransferase [Erythrobacter sp. SDW2]|uniref:molybdenum cofactor guanylyltransferase n=1 Tax=Erythrobacter sp. SDW2 TaxID=2907154 RepID=UPI001F347998|nr:molybdenum cofactor guanylyltransferase [Erythrobacter sp. SDW2]UIP07864.1 molybdenum cofactor guanylyltransferase [Erythrobacter sp. SDW2]
MRLLGAILAGGQSRRFGSDKALALVDGERLIDRVATALAEQCEAVVVCGREEADFACLDDMPEQGLGPLGGLNAALHHALTAGYDAVLSSGCDVPNLPADLAQQLAGDGAAHASEQPVVGLWPVALAPQCNAFLQSGGRSLYGFGEHVGARLVAVSPPLRNVNAPEDLGLPEIQ